MIVGFPRGHSEFNWVFHGGRNSNLGCSFCWVRYSGIEACDAHPANVFPLIHFQILHVTVSFLSLTYTEMMDKFFGQGTVIFSLNDLNTEITKVIKFLDYLMKISLPLLHLFYAISRFIVILHPQLIPKFCSKRASIFAIVLVFLLCGIVSLLNLFGDDLSFVALRRNDPFHDYYVKERYAIKKENHNEQDTIKKENYKDILIGLNIFFTLTLATIVSIFLIFLTKRMNDSLKKSISFLNSMENERCKMRSASYTKIINLNILLLLITLFSLTVTLSETLLMQLFPFMDQHIGLDITTMTFLLRFTYFSLIMLSNLAILLTPLIFLSHTPSIKKSWGSVMKRLFTRLKLCKED